MPSVSVIIPALDEEQSIGAVLDAIPRHLAREIVVVDGGSHDATVAVARARGARVVNEPLRGYGRACVKGVSEANGDVLVFLDADGSSDPRDIEALVAPILKGDLDLVLGSRLHPYGDRSIDRGAMPLQQRLGNKLGAFLIRILYRLPLTDLGPYRAVRRRALLALPLQNLTYGWPTEMIVRAANAGWRIVVVPVSSRSRTGGRSKISGTIRGASLAAAHIIGVILRSAPLGRRTAVAAPPEDGWNPPASVVVIMARQPMPGRTKTRLCPPLSAAQAAGLYECMLKDTIGVVSGVRGTAVAIAVTPATAVSEMEGLVPRGELLYGARRSARVTENLRVLAAFFAPLVSIPFDDVCAEQYGALRASLVAAGHPIGPNDLLIAATSLAYDLTLVTHNLREFSRIPALKIEDWEEAAP